MLKKGSRILEDTVIDGVVAVFTQALTRVSALPRTLDNAWTPGRWFASY